MFDLCVSPRDDGSRCIEYVIGDSKFCKKHSAIFRSKYLLYKELEKDIDAIPQTPQQALRLYGRLRKAYDLRSNYRKEAFVPEKWDRGHDLWMSYILKRMGEIEIMLKEWFQPVKEEPINENEPDDSKYIFNDYEELKTDYVKTKSQENDFDKILEEAVKTKQQNLVILCSRIAKYEKELQEKLNVNYIKDFFYFLNVPAIIYKLNKRKEKEIGNELKINNKTTIYASFEHTLDFLKIKRNYIEFYLSVINNINAELFVPFEDDVLISIHNIFSKLDKKKLVYRCFKTELVRASVLKSGKHVLMRTDAIKIVFYNSSEQYHMVAMDIIGMNGLVRGLKAEMEYYTNFKYKDKEVRTHLKKLKRLLKLNASSVKYSINNQTTPTDKLIEMATEKKLDPKEEIIAINTGKEVKFLLANLTKAKSTLLAEINVDKYEQGENITINTIVIVYHLISRTSAIYDYKNIEYLFDNQRSDVLEQMKSIDKRFNG